MDFMVWKSFGGGKKAGEGRMQSKRAVSCEEGDEDSLSAGKPLLYLFRGGALLDMAHEQTTDEGNCLLYFIYHTYCTYINYIP